MYVCFGTRIRLMLSGNNCFKLNRTLIDALQLKSGVIWDDEEDDCLFSPADIRQRSVRLE